MKEDRRQSDTRVKVHIEVDLEAYNAYTLSRLENISAGGAFISTQNLQPVGTDVQVSFVLPDNPHPIKAEGQVIWVYQQRGKTGNNSSGMGIQFTRISDADRDKIRDFVEKHRDVF